MKVSHLLFIVAVTFPYGVPAQSFKQLAWDSVKSPWIYGPSLAAVALILSGQDGKITDYALEQRPIFNNVGDAELFADNMTFYYLPVYSALTTGLYIHYRSHVPEPIQYISFLPGPLATYGVNYVLKDQSGRLRPDSSNRQSFPSAHTALASSLVQTSRLNLRALTGKKRLYYPITVSHELLVVGIAWARLEAKKHHISDVLVGYSIGKFFSNFFHKWFFGEYVENRITFTITDPKNMMVQLQWRF